MGPDPHAQPEWVALTLIAFLFLVVVANVVCGVHMP